MRLAVGVLSASLAALLWVQPLLPQQRPSETKRLRVTPEVMERQLIRRVEPEYPALAREARIQGIVRLEILVGTDGAVRSVRVISGHPLLVDAATSAVNQWRYKPMRWKGGLVEVVTTVEVRFPPQKPRKAEPHLRPA